MKIFAITLIYLLVNFLSFLFISFIVIILVKVYIIIVDVKQPDVIYPVIRFIIHMKMNMKEIIMICT